MKNNRVLKNASWIIACKIAQALLGLLISTLTARYLGPSNFGLINYAASIIAFAVPILHLGLNSIVVQELIEHPDEEGTIVGTSAAMCFVSSLLCVAGSVAFAMIANAGEKDTITVVALYSILLLFQSFEVIQYWFQAKFLSKYTSLIMLAAYIAVSAYKFWLLASDKSVYWFSISNAFDYLIIAVLLVILYRKVGTQKMSFSAATAKRMFAKSRSYILSDLMVTIFAQTDRIMLKLMIDNSAAGYYSVAVICAGLVNFVFAAIIDSAIPSILESRKDSYEAFSKKLTSLYSVIIYCSLAVCLGTTVFSRFIVMLLYGADYEPSISALQIIVWYTTFSYLGAVRNIWILAEQKQKYLWVINLLGASANVLLNYILIPVMGINGAALASLLTQFFTNVVVGYIVKPIRENNRIMVNSLDPRNLTELLRMFR